MIIVGKVLSIYSATDESQSLPRPAARHLECIEGHGIKNDKFAGKDLEKTVMVIGERSYNMAKEIGVKLEPGSLGENILFDFDPHYYPDGTRFKIGDVILEVTEDCSMCKHLTMFDTRLPKLLKHKRGRYCRIIQSGTIVTGQTVSL